MFIKSLPPELIEHFASFLSRTSYIALRSTCLFFHNTLPQLEHKKGVYEELGKELRHVPVLLRMATLKYCNGPGQTAVPGTNLHVLVMLVMATWGYCNGPEQMGARGTSGHVYMLLERVFLKW